ncbi:uncharacterized protein LOC144880036 [Branchiostoma floridae x Branchiostoma japonicum]
MGYKMFLGLCALLMVVMVEQTDAICCHAKITCQGWLWDHHCEHHCPDGTKGTPFCSHGPCNLFGCSCIGHCKTAKRGVLEEARSLLELLREGQEDTAPERAVMPGREFELHDKNKDRKLSKEEALGMLEDQGVVDIDNLPDDWFETMDTNGNGYIEPNEYDVDLGQKNEGE